LQFVQLGQVAEQAQRAGYFALRLEDWRDGYAELTDLPRRSRVLDLLVLRGASFAQATAQQACQRRFRPEHVEIAPIAQRPQAERGLGGRVRRRNQSGSVHQQKPGRHVARNRFTEPFRLLCALLFQPVQPFEFLFLLAEPPDDCLHRGGHECGLVFAPWRRRGQLVAGLRPVTAGRHAAAQEPAQGKREQKRSQQDEQDKCRSSRQPHRP
jgi:hypothetical protein